MDLDAEDDLFADGDDDGDILTGTQIFVTAVAPHLVIDVDDDHATHYSNSPILLGPDVLEGLEDDDDDGNGDLVGVAYGAAGEEEPDLFDTPARVIPPAGPAVLSILPTQAVREDPKSLAQTANELLSFGVPLVVVREYAKRGVHSVYPWQKACLECPDVLDKGANLVYCAPTSGGKTLVAEVIMVRRWVSQRRRCIFVLPYVAVVEEKASYFSSLLEPLGVEVQCHAGRKGQRHTFGDVAVCTIEKANNIINESIQNGKLADIGLLVIDEAHMIDDSGRGYLLELMITKLLFAGAALDIQIVAMSATLPNAWQLATWLRDAQFFATDFRPVPLLQFCKFGTKIVNNALQPVRDVSPTCPADTDGLVALVVEVIAEGHQALVFCATKKMCETTALHLARLCPRCAEEPSDVIADRHALLHTIRSVPGGADPNLEEATAVGFAFHHAGLTVDEREVIEACYRRGSLRVLCCTTTLAAGVNLPARRVIFRTPRLGIDELDIVTYRQAAGRAGRAGLDTHGESFLIAKESERAQVTALLTRALPPLRSSLRSDRCGLTRALLEAFALGVVKTVYDVQRFIQCTFFHSQSPYEEVHLAAQQALQFLEKSSIIQWHRSSKVFNSSLLGSACVAASMPPDQGLFVYEELNRSRDHFVVSDDLHFLYHVTPPNQGIEPYWRGYYADIFQHMRQSNYKTATAVGIDEGFLISAQQIGLPKVRNDEMLRKVFVHRRFYAALLLQDVIHEVPLSDISAKFHISRGEVQKIMESASTFSSMVATFCDTLNWWFFSAAFEKITQRLKQGVENDLLPLMRIPTLRSWKARILYKSGLRSVEDIANANVSDIERMFLAKTPFEGKKEGHETNAQMTENRAARLLVKGAKTVLYADASELEMTSRDVMKTVATHQKTQNSKSAHARSRDEESDVNSSDSEALLTGSESSEDNKNVKPFLDETPLKVVVRREIAFTKVKLLQDVLSRCENGQRVGVCVHAATGGSSKFSIAIAVNPDTCYFHDALSETEFIILSSWLQNSSIKKACFDWKMQCKVFCVAIGSVVRFHGFEDPVIAHWILNPSDATHAVSMEQLLSKYNVPARTPPRDAPERICKCAFESLSLMDRIGPQLVTHNVRSCFDVLEMPLVEVLASMELCGIGFESVNYMSLASKMRKKMSILVAQSVDVTGVSNWDLSCPQDCARMLFDNQQLPVVEQNRGGKVVRRRKVETRTSNAGVLRKLKALHPENPLPDIIREFRTLSGWLVKYVLPIPSHVLEERVHGTFLHTSSATGRLSMLEPNLQTIPHPVVFDLHGTEIVMDLRRAFVARPQCVLISADYAHIELRVLAHFSDDASLSAALSSAEDVFRSLASQLFSVSEDKVTFELRKRAKAMCYGVIYGKGKRSLAEDLEITVEEAAEIMAQFSAKYPNIARCKKSIIDRCRKTGYVETLFGRRRYFRDIFSRNSRRSSAAERAAVNTVCQGSAADIMKRAMIDLHSYLSTSSHSAQIVLQIHDELLLEVPESEAGVIAQDVRKIMERAVVLSVPTPVHIMVGKTWADVRN